MEVFWTHQLNRKIKLLLETVISVRQDRLIGMLIYDGDVVCVKPG